MASVLRANVEKWRDEESWKKDHHEVMECYDLQDTISYGLYLLEGIQRHEARWKQDVKTGRCQFDPDNAAEIIDLYEWWYRPVPDVLRQIKEMESNDHHVEGADMFRAKVELFHQTQFDPQRIQSSLKQFSRGEGRPLQELKDAVRRRHVG